MSGPAGRIGFYIPRYDSALALTIAVLDLTPSNFRITKTRGVDARVETPCAGSRAACGQCSPWHLYTTRCACGGGHRWRCRPRSSTPRIHRNKRRHTGRANCWPAGSHEVPIAQVFALPTLPSPRTERPSVCHLTSPYVAAASPPPSAWEPYARRMSGGGGGGGDDVPGPSDPAKREGDFTLLQYVSPKLQLPPLETAQAPLATRPVSRYVPSELFRHNIPYAQPGCCLLASPHLPLPHL
jgi:hypothetical protein